MKKAETREMLSKGGTTDGGGWVATGKTSYVGRTAWSIIQCTSCKKRMKTFEYLRWLLKSFKLVPMEDSIKQIENYILGGC